MKASKICSYWSRRVSLRHVGSGMLQRGCWQDLSVQLDEVLMRGMLFGWENSCVSESLDDKLGRQYI